MITFEKQNNIEVAAIDIKSALDSFECLQCVFIMNSKTCKNTLCRDFERTDKRNVFFLSVYDKRILNYKNK